MDGRKLLSVGALLCLLLLSGCSAAGSLSMEPATDEAIAESASRSLPPADVAPRERDVVTAAIENGSTTETARIPSIEPGLPFAYEGRYYDVTRTLVDEQPGYVVDVQLDPNGSATDAETVPYEDLTPSDRAAIDALLRAAADRPRPPDAEDSEAIRVGVVATYNETERERSVLLSGEYTAVRRDGETHVLEIEDPRPTTIGTYRYETTVVANSTAAYADRLRERYAFTLSGLSEGQRDVVESAIDGSYYAENTDDENFRSVVELFRRHDPIEEYGGTYLVRYEGETYVARLSHGGFDVTSTSSPGR